MKTRHIIAIGLLTASAVGLLAFGINKNRKTIQSKAEDELIYIYTNSNAIEHTEHLADSYQEFYINGSWQIQYSKNITQNTYNLRTYIQFYLESKTQNPIYVYQNQNLDKIIIEKNETTQLATNNFTIGFTFNSINFYGNSFVYNFTINLNETNFRYSTGHSFYSTGTWQQCQTAFGTTEDTSIYQEIGQYSPQFVNYLIEESYQNGYTAGQTNGYQTGYTEGYENALTENQEQIYQQGYNTGYGIGYNDSEAFNHPIDLMPTMLNILTMPFTFISQAFDVTLWPGTQYQINIGNFIKAIIAISAILFIIRLFTTGFSIIGNYTNNYQNNQLTKEKRKLVKAQTNLANRTDPNRKTIRKE